MALWCTGTPEFKPGEKVVALVYHPPEIEPGISGTVVSPQTGSLYAVQLPNGELHRWLAGFELEPLKPGLRYWELMNPGSLARVKSAQGHPPHIKEGMIVRIVQAISAPFYEVMIKGKHHRWLAEFELASSGVVS